MLPFTHEYTPNQSSHLQVCHLRDCAGDEGAVLFAINNQFSRREVTWKK